LNSLLDFLRPRGRNQDRAAAADPVPQLPPPRRPSVGLVLGGGAALGFAHIGVIRALLASGIVPEVIAGTSMGAVVGGCYAAGQLDAFESWARGLTARGVLGYLDFNFSGSGLIWGNRLTRRLEASLGDVTIEELPCRYAAIATEIGTGHEIWLTRGRLVEAMRASYTLPGIFAPAHLGGRWLVDGTLVNPVPVAAARALGARLVVAVNLNSEVFGRGTTIADHGADSADELTRSMLHRRRQGIGGLFRPEQIVKREILGQPGRPGIITAMVEAFNIMQDRIARSRLAGDPPDVLISPRLRGIGLFEFHRAADAIALGHEATEKAIEPLTEALAALG
jgi:NTE family protein